MLVAATASTTGEIVLVSGEAGIGKSSLVRTFTASAAEIDVRSGCVR